MSDLVLVGAIAGAHGVRGAVRVKSFTAEPEGVAAYGPVCDESGQRRFRMKVIGPTRGGVVAQLEGVSDRNAAEALRGLRLYVPRAALPEPEADEFYQADLIGLAVETVAGERIGRVRAVQNYGAGDILDIERPGAPPLDLPFTRAVVPVVDVAGGRLVVDPPAEVEARPEDREVEA